MKKRFIFCIEGVRNPDLSGCGLSGCCTLRNPDFSGCGIWRNPDLHIQCEKFKLRNPDLSGCGIRINLDLAVCNIRINPDLLSGCAGFVAYVKSGCLIRIFMLNVKNTDREILINPDVALCQIRICPDAESRQSCEIRIDPNVKSG